MTTSEIQDATPAALFSHVTGRKCYGPVETLEKCSTNALEEMAVARRILSPEQLLVTRADVTLGAVQKFCSNCRCGRMKVKR